MEEYFSLQDVVLTGIQNKVQGIIPLIEFRTYGDMFDTINHALYEMITLYNIDYEFLDERLCENDSYGWDFSEKFLPYIKQMIYKAIDAHDLRAPEDMLVHRRNIQQQVQLEYDYYILAKCSGKLSQKTTHPFQKQSQERIHPIHNFIKRIFRQ